MKRFTKRKSTVNLNSFRTVLGTSSAFDAQSSVGLEYALPAPK